MELYMGSLGIVVDLRKILFSVISRGSIKIK